jgi:hypothetical protein
MSNSNPNVSPPVSTFRTSTPLLLFAGEAVHANRELRAKTRSRPLARQTHASSVRERGIRLHGRRKLARQVLVRAGQLHSKSFGRFAGVEGHADAAQ